MVNGPDGSKGRIFGLNEGCRKSPFGGRQLAADPADNEKREDALGERGRCRSVRRPGGLGGLDPHPRHEDRNRRRAARRRARAADPVGAGTRRPRTRPAQQTLRALLTTPVAVPLPTATGTALTPAATAKVVPTLAGIVDGATRSISAAQPAGAPAPEGVLEQIDGSTFVHVLVRGSAPVEALDSIGARDVQPLDLIGGAGALVDWPVVGDLAARTDVSSCRPTRPSRARPGPARLQQPRRPP